MKKASLIFSTAFITLIIVVSCGKGGTNKDENDKQEWMSENLDIVTFRNGDTIFHAKTDEDWKAARRSQTPSWCFYENDSVNGLKYGRLYNWYAVSDPRNLAPEGWKIPSVEDWFTLIESLGEINFAANNLRSTSWGGLTNKETNKTGFSGMPGGGRNGLGEFYDINEVGIWWTSSTEGVASWSIILHSEGIIKRMADNSYGFSVRCIKD
jgi:uncharacterized protein (TIGR02145 family)